MKKIQFITCDRVKDYYGVTSGLFNSASFVVNFLKKCGYDAIITPVKDSNWVDRIVTEHDPHIVVIEALWITPEKYEELLSIPRHAERTWIVRVHSKAPFLANEGIATEWIRKYTEIEGKKIYIAPNTEELNEQLKTAFGKGKFVELLNVYHPNRSKEFPPKRREKEWIDIGCFGAIRPLKNNYQQALAAIAFAEKLGKRVRFHVNSSRMEQSGENVVKNLRALFTNSVHSLVEHPWYKHEDFLEVISTMDIGMQVSFSESFNIVTADFVEAGVPIVVSKDIDWMPGFLRSQPTSHHDMIKKLTIAWNMPKLTTFLQKLALDSHNVAAKESWFYFLQSLEH